ncbi:MAG: tetratricopeptide repeat protein [Litoreibacter sp.]|nr:tetratricopeptide repeat protein [Litoreibacter sp.]
MIGKAKAGRDINFIRTGIGAIGISFIVGVAVVVNNMSQPSPTLQLDIAGITEAFEDQGFLAPEDAAALQDQLVRTQADLDELRALNPDWAQEVNTVIDAVNNAEPDAARQAFANLRELIAERRTELRIEEARLNHAEATLLYSFEVSKAEPLLCAAAYLADQDFFYWIDCGEARMSVGDLKAAQAAFEKASGLTTDKPNSRDAMIAKNWFGNVHVSKGELSPALQVYEAGLKISRELAARDPGNADWAREVSVFLNKVGDVRRAQGDLPGALSVYEEGLQIIRDLAARAPGNAGWARDLSVSLNKVGDVRRAQGDLPGALTVYEEGLQIRRDLAARDPGNAGWARDVSVLLNKVADVRLAQGDLSGALTVYEESLQIARDLAARDPGNAGWARDVSVALNKVGDVCRAQGNLPGALTVYEEGLQIRRDLAARDPGNADWARDVWVSLWKMARIDTENAAQHWAEVVTRMEDLQVRGILLSPDELFLEQARANHSAAQ